MNLLRILAANILVIIGLAVVLVVFLGVVLPLKRGPRPLLRWQLFLGCWPCCYCCPVLCFQVFDGYNASG
jgi:hypothetical protein